MHGRTQPQIADMNPPLMQEFTLATLVLGATPFSRLRPFVIKPGLECEIPWISSIGCEDFTFCGRLLKVSGAPDQ